MGIKISRDRFGNDFRGNICDSTNKFGFLRKLAQIDMLI